MHIPFSQLPPDSRIWIYQADRPFSDAEEKIISENLKGFCSRWEAHGNPLQTSFAVEHKQFVVLSVNENTAGASGCSIDGSVRVLKELGQHLNIDFFNRAKVAFLIEDEVRLYSLPELQTLFKTETLNRSSTTFNNLVSDKSAFESSWKTSAEKSWLVKYLPKSALSL
ncbi:hypothetical protein WSM22_16450 [Cytophagales bacterium WSM2-2]|nr:hypothetical protein WSM22_16450 [Cytophagales bacterium WSM2-2]